MKKEKLFSFLPVDFVDQLGSFSRTFFYSDLARFLWAILPLISLLLGGKNK